MLASLTFFCKRTKEGGANVAAQEGKGGQDPGEVTIRGERCKQTASRPVVWV